jgi:hypothetical protein
MLYPVIPAVPRSLHLMDIPACLGGYICMRRLCIPFLLRRLRTLSISFFFVASGFRYIIRCVLKTTDGIIVN